MGSKQIKMKGSNTPSLIVFMHGFLDGRFRTACIDQDSNILNSAYVNGKINLYHKYCSECVKRLETDISSICTDAETLLMELESMPDDVGVERPENVGGRIVQKPPKSIEEAQTAREAARKQANAANASAEKMEKKRSLHNRRTQIVQQLVQTRDRISNRESNCYYDLEVTQFALRERFCIYGHGVLLKPMLNRYIPKMEYEWAFARYNRNHEDLKRRINEVVKKEDVENA